jgi:hypothetical protein
MGFPNDEISKITNIGGQFATVPYQMLLAVLLLRKRKKEPINLILTIISVLLSIFAGSIGGLVPVAILSMRRVEKA